MELFVPVCDWSELLLWFWLFDSHLKTPTNHFNNKLRNLHQKISQGAKIWNDTSNDTRLLSLKRFKKNLMLIHLENNIQLSPEGEVNSGGYIPRRFASR